MISAEVICDSISEAGKRLTTFKLRYPKFIHGESKTHRVISWGNEGGYIVMEQEVGLMDDKHLSRNASSSRAVPTRKLLAEIRSGNFAVPERWGKDQKGMQAAEDFSPDVPCQPGKEVSELEFVQKVWAMSAMSACEHAQALLDFGAHKQLVNRILEPYTHINVVVTATEWDNFFGLRLHKDADPTMRALAVAMWEDRQKCKPQLRKDGEWHLPFIDKDTEEQLFRRSFKNGVFDRDWHLDLCRKVSVARCARVSYESFETGKRSTVEEDLPLYDKLFAGLQDTSAPLHASPAEHQARPDQKVTPFARTGRITDKNGDFVWLQHELHGNLVGWCQYRKMLPGEACAPLPEGFAP